MLRNIIRLELKRLFGRKKLLVLGILGIGLLIIGTISYLEMWTPQRTSFEAFSFATGIILPMALPLLVGLSTGDLLAEDRRLGLVPLFLSKGVSPYQYIFGKTMGNIIGQTCFTGGLLIIFLLISSLLFPAGPILVYSADYYAGTLAANNPVAYCLGLLLIYVCAATAFSGVALLASVWIKNILVVMSIPTIIYFGLFYLLITSFIEVNPYCYLALNEGSFSTLPLTFSKAGLYWITISFTTHALAIVTFSLKKDYS